VANSVNLVLKLVLMLSVGKLVAVVDVDRLKVRDKLTENRWVFIRVRVYCDVWFY